MVSNKANGLRFYAEKLLFTTWGFVISTIKCTNNLHTCLLFSTKAYNLVLKFKHFNSVTTMKELLLDPQNEEFGKQVVALKKTEKYLITNCLYPLCQYSYRHTYCSKENGELENICFDKIRSKNHSIRAHKGKI